MSIAQKHEDDAQEQVAGSSEGPLGEASDVGSGPEDEDYDSTDEMEPLLNYSRAPAALFSALGRKEPTAVAAHRDMVVIGTRDGCVIRHRDGDEQAITTRPHGNRVTAVSLDDAGTALGSCGDDGLVSIACPLDGQPTTYALGKPLRAMAIDPAYTSKREKAVVSGGLAAKVVLNRRGWLTAQGSTLHAREGVIHAIAWRGPFVAWANAVGVKVMDLQRNARVSFVQKPHGCPGPDTCTCHLAWQDDETLLIGWADCIKILALKRTDEAGLQQGLPPVYGELLTSFNTDFLVCGIAPFNDDLLVALAYIPAVPDEDGDEQFARAVGGQAASATQANVVPPAPVLAEQPEMRILHRMTGDEVTADILPVRGWEHHRANQYALAWVPASPDSVAAARAEPAAAVTGTDDVDRRPFLFQRLVVLAPEDVVEARPRTANDSVEWAVEAGKYEDALLLVEQHGQAVSEEVQQRLAGEYLDTLLDTGDAKLAASLCPKLLGDRVDMWVEWVPRFREAGRLGDIIPHIPVHSPRLPSAMYEGALRHLIHTDPPLFLSTLRRWPLPEAKPPTRASSGAVANDGTRSGARPARRAHVDEGALFSVPALLADLQREVKVHSSEELRDALAELLVLEGRVEEALDCFLSRPSQSSSMAHRHAGRVFDLIDRHALQSNVRRHVVSLMELDPSRACEVLLSDLSLFPIEVVAGQLEARPRLLRMYLHALLVMRHAEYNVPQYAHLHARQVQLYAEYDASALGWLLRSSDQYSLEEAYEECRRHSRSLAPERVFLLQRMGNSKEALRVLVEEQGSAPAAIRFVEEAEHEELWTHLVDHAMSHPYFLGELLESLGDTSLNAREVVEKIPEGTEIPQLKQRLIRLFRGQQQQESCMAVVRSDVRDLVLKALRERKRGVLARVTPEIQADMRSARNERKQAANESGAGPKARRRRPRYVAVSLTTGKVTSGEEFRAAAQQVREQREAGVDDSGQ